VKAVAAALEKARRSRSSFRFRWVVHG
jgi:hypothetical protein